jgi:hypothetical protein
MGSKQRNQIVMTDEEITEFVARSRTGTMATIGPDGQPHLVAMWYAVLDGEIWVETKVKSQKVVNLRRDPRVSFLIEDGIFYGAGAGGGVAPRPPFSCCIFSTGQPTVMRNDTPSQAAMRSRCEV